MSLPSPTLHMLCGKIASGKSTLAAELGSREKTVVIAQDAWLDMLYGGEMSSISDYVRCESKLRAIMGTHVAALLNAGISVVLDFPANTLDTRNWMRGILDRTAAAHLLHVLDVSDELCLARLRRRNASGGNPFTVTDEQFHRISGHFLPPSPDEGFKIEVHKVDTKSG